MKFLSGVILVVALFSIGATPRAPSEMNALKAENTQLKTQVATQKELIQSLEVWQTECMTRDFQRLQQSRKTRK